MCVSARAREFLDVDFRTPRKLSLRCGRASAARERASRSVGGREGERRGGRQAGEREPAAEREDPVEREEGERERVRE